MHAHITPRTNVVRVGSFVYMYDTPLSGLNFSLNKHVQDSANIVVFSQPVPFEALVCSLLEGDADHQLDVPRPSYISLRSVYSGSAGKFGGQVFLCPQNCNRMDTID